MEYVLRNTSMLIVHILEQLHMTATGSATETVGISQLQAGEQQLLADVSSNVVSTDINTAMKSSMAEVITGVAFLRLLDECIDVA
jgi:hypothetical protein